MPAEAGEGQAEIRPTKSDLTPRSCTGIFLEAGEGHRPARHPPQRPLHLIPPEPSIPRQRLHLVPDRHFNLGREVTARRLRASAQPAAQFPFPIPRGPSRGLHVGVVPVARLSRSALEPALPRARLLVLSRRAGRHVLPPALRTTLPPVSPLRFHAWTLPRTGAHRDFNRPRPSTFREWISPPRPGGSPRGRS
jgi:hypothetical protein